MTSAVETKHNPGSDRMQSIGKLIALCSFAAMMSTFGPFALVAPAAIALALIHFGRMKVFGVCLLLTVGIYMLGGQNLNSLGSTGSFLFSFLIGLMIDFFILKRTHPVKGVLFGGMSAYLVLAIIIMSGTIISDTSLTEFVGTQVESFITQMKETPEYSQIISAGGDQARELRKIVESPELLTEQIVNWIPAVGFVGIFFSLWASFYFVLRNSLAWRSRRKYPFGLLHLTFFKLPFWVVYILITGLVLSLVGDSIEGYDFSIVGYNVLYGLGTLYFFQGFGVVYDYLTVKGYKGLIKSLLIMTAVVFMWRFVVLLGVLDLWINFRKFYVKKIEGDKK